MRFDYSWKLSSHGGLIMRNKVQSNAELTKCENGAVY